MASKSKNVFIVLEEIQDAIREAFSHGPHAEILEEVRALKQQNAALRDEVAGLRAAQELGQQRIEASLARIEEFLGEPPEEEAQTMDITEGPPEEQQ